MSHLCCLGAEISWLFHKETDLIPFSCVCVFKNLILLIIFYQSIARVLVILIFSLLTSSASVVF